MRPHTWRFHDVSINVYVDSFNMSNSTHQFGNLNSIRPFSYLAEKFEN